MAKKLHKTIRKAVFPVGGLGTRFLPATKALPKEMLPVVDKPLVHYAFEEAQAAGIEQFIFVTGRNKNAITNHFDHSYELQRVLSEKDKLTELEKTKNWLPHAGNIVFTRQMEPLGLGHAIWCARDIIGNEPFAVILADDLIQSDTPCLLQMLRHYQGGNMAAVMDIPKEKTQQYGILDIDYEKDAIVRAKGLVEKPTPADSPSTLSIIGRYILEPDIFDVLSAQNKGNNGEVQLTDAMCNMIPNTPFYGYRFEGKRFDCGERVGFVEANLAFALARDDMHERITSMVKKYV